MNFLGQKSNASATFQVPERTVKIAQVLVFGIWGAVTGAYVIYWILARVLTNLGLYDALQNHSVSEDVILMSPGLILGGFIGITVGLSKSSRVRRRVFFALILCWVVLICSGLWSFWEMQ